MSKSSIEKFYVIIDTRSLEYLDIEGYTTTYIQNAEKYGTFEEAKKELSELDNQCAFQIYKVTQVIETSFELCEEVSEQ